MKITVTIFDDKHELVDRAARDLASAGLNYVLLKEHFTPVVSSKYLIETAADMAKMILAANGMEHGVKPGHSIEIAMTP